MGPEPWYPAVEDVHPASALATDQLIQLLEEVRGRAARARPCELPAIEASLAALECDAAVRGLVAPGDVAERTPPALAAHLAESALLEGDGCRLLRLLNHLDVTGLWRTYRHVRRLCAIDDRIWYGRLILYRLDALLYGSAWATARISRVERAAMEPEELDAWLAECIGALFASLMLGPKKA